MVKKHMQEKGNFVMRKRIKKEKAEESKEGEKEREEKEI